MLFYYKPEDILVEKYTFLNGNPEEYHLKVRVYEMKWKVFGEFIPKDDFKYFVMDNEFLYSDGIFKRLEDVKAVITVLLMPHNSLNGTKETVNIL
jgi:hypothetical protein